MTAATASPTWRTRSVESAQCWRPGAWLVAPPSAEALAGGIALASLRMSSPVTMWRTPGSLSAARASIFRILACACGLRTNATHSIPGSATSVT